MCFISLPPGQFQQSPVFLMPGKQQYQHKGRQQHHSSPDCQQSGALGIRGQGKGLVRSKGFLHQMDGGEPASQHSHRAAGDGGAGKDGTVNPHGFALFRTQQPTQAVLIAAVGSQQHRKDQHRRRKGRRGTQQHQLPPGLHGVKALLHIVPAGVLHDQCVSGIGQNRLVFCQKILIVGAGNFEGEGIGLLKLCFRDFLRREEMSL